ncbi:hypothetical protein Pla123a_10340 [Posidoniimonas polymericola]|uniref:Uncharacterized protein n=1 Tax=Posidoniimonas polymericola TaxID=2528002 RepID=A0A5C5YUA1_9BACT|nr:hypothetical protein [Posidoniimonas polymericola]TWT78243.1 hypothetical protein Pla123a_10340 [Posidoniimonas polymericola]
MRMKLCALVVCAASAVFANAQGVVEETGTLPELVERLTSHDYLLQHPSQDSRPYVEPGDALRLARRAASLMAVGELQQAAVTAAQIGYELVDFHDTESRNRYFVLREDLASIEQLRGWGAYLLNPAPKFNTLVEAPHPLGDSETAPLAARVFESGARGLLIAGAHRKKADLPDFVESVFHQVHSAWMGGQTLLPVLQVHGFAARKHDFPKDAQLILSTGGGSVTKELLKLDERLDEHGFPSYVYNTLDPTSNRNRRVNGDSAGSRFRSLAATKNVQGQHARGEGSAFMHLEFDYDLRHDKDRSVKAAEVVASAMLEIASVESFNAPIETPPTITVARNKPPRSNAKNARRGG